MTIATSFPRPSSPPPARSAGPPPPPCPLSSPPAPPPAPTRPLAANLPQLLRQTPSGRHVLMAMWRQNLVAPVHARSPHHPGSASPADRLRGRRARLHPTPLQGEEQVRQAAAERRCAVGWPLRAD